MIVSAANLLGSSPTKEDYRKATKSDLKLVIAAFCDEIEKREEESTEPTNTTVYRSSLDWGEQLSTERASCEECGTEGWRGDFPDQGGIVHYEGTLICDPCWTSLYQEKPAPLSGGICGNCETWQSDPEDCLHCASLQEEVRVCEEYAAQASSEAPQQTQEEAPSNSPSTLEQLTDAIPGEPWEDPEADRFLDDKVAAYNAEQRRKAASKGSNGTSSPKAKGKVKASPSTSTTSKKLVLAGDESREVYAPHRESGERISFVISTDGTTTTGGISYGSPRKALRASGAVKPTGSCQVWNLLRFTDEAGVEHYADALRVKPAGYKLRGKKAPAKAKASPEEKAKAKVEKLQAKLKAAQEELAKLQG